ncbi:amidohydrolase [Leucobacter weissii]|uniref:Amidohydrolase n=1 Tax=Leucobacter weissii TaxID=1983706 RepID=A0A939MTL1_9MICO|nr:amidohydrolase [Leucobacter weissii]MBO1902749.1 amidohydrolase [Leucobacter weissii]
MTTRLYRNAAVFTGDAEGPGCEAFAVRDGRILAVGELDPVRSAAGPEAEEIDLGGAFVAPGIIEGHAHLAMLGEALDKVPLRDCTTVAEVQQRLAEARRADPEATRLLGVSWRFDIFADGERPTAALLDAAVPDVPVLLDANDLHSVWANTAALRAMGIDRDTPDPVGGEIVRDEHGDATGFLLETAAIAYAWGYLARTASDEDRDRFFDNAFRAYLATGVTGATDMSTNDTDIAALRRRIDRDGRLPFPVRGHWLLTATGDPEADLAQIDRVAALRDELAGLPGAEWLGIVGVKFILDGTIDACTAAMREPYANGALPDPIWTRERAVPVAVAADAAGLQLALHAIGDEASTIALDAVEACLRRNGPRANRRPRIEHLEYVADDTIARMAALGVTASMQPVHCDPAVLDNWQAVLGDERALGGFPWHEFRARGVALALGTDAPTAPHEAPPNLFIAITARSALDRAREPYQPQRVFTPAAALAALTAGTARAAGMEAEYGRIAAGYRANLFALDANPLSDDPDRLLEARVLLTLVDGAEAYRYAP